MKKDHRPKKLKPRKLIQIKSKNEGKYTYMCYEWYDWYRLTKCILTANMHSWILGVLCKKSRKVVSCSNNRSGVKLFCYFVAWSKGNCRNKWLILSCNLAYGFLWSITTPKSQIDSNWRTGNFRLLNACIRYLALKSTVYHKTINFYFNFNWCCFLGNSFSFEPAKNRGKRL